MENDENKKEPGAIESPKEFLPEKPEFDYNKLQDETTYKAVGEILKCLGRNAELFVFTHDTKNEKIMENFATVEQEILNLIIDCKVPNTDLQLLSDQLTTVIYQIFKGISKQNKEFEKELLARTIGTRNPGNGKYSREYATLGDMFEALIKIRKDQGDNTEDYFFIEKKKEE